MECWYQNSSPYSFSIYCSFYPRTCFKHLVIRIKSYFTIFQCCTSITKKNTKAQLRKLNQTRSVYDLQQRSRYWVTIRGQDRYIVLNYLRVRWKLATKRQDKRIWSFHMINTWWSIHDDQYMILGEHIERWPSVCYLSYSGQWSDCTLITSAIYICTWINLCRIHSNVIYDFLIKAVYRYRPHLLLS